MNKRINTFIIIVTALSLLGCSTSKLTVDLVGETVKSGIGAFYEESDNELARHGLESNIKLLEVFHKSEPSNEEIRVLLSQAYGGYAYVFIDTELLNSPRDKEKSLRLGSRMNEFYSRGLRYGLSILNDDVIIKRALETSDMSLLESELLNIKDADALFWTSFNWALLINSNRDSADRLVELPKIKALLERMLELDRSYFHGAPLALKGVIECSMPKMLGGKPKDGADLMEEALKISDRKFLIIQLLYAQYCAPALQDKKLFHKLMDEIQKAPLGEGDVVLINNAVKLKTPQIKTSVAELFVDE